MGDARGGHADCVRMLLPVSDARAKSSNGMTALVHASGHGRSGCVQIRLPVGAWG